MYIVRVYLCIQSMGTYSGWHAAVTAFQYFRVTCCFFVITPPRVSLRVVAHGSGRRGLDKCTLVRGNGNALPTASGSRVTRNRLVLLFSFFIADFFDFFSLFLLYFLSSAFLRAVFRPCTYFEKRTVCRAFSFTSGWDFVF